MDKTINWGVRPIEEMWQKVKLRNINIVFFITSLKIKEYHVASDTLQINLTRQTAMTLNAIQFNLQRTDWGLQAWGPTLKLQLYILYSSSFFYHGEMKTLRHKHIFLTQWKHPSCVSVNWVKIRLYTKFQLLMASKSCYFFQSKSEVAS